MEQFEKGTVQDLLEGWASLWGVSGLSCEVSFNPRLRSSLGRCLPAQGKISLHPELQERYRHLYQEVLCHEFAHVAAVRLHGPGVAAHGKVWAGLMQLAGFPARIRVAVDLPAICSPPRQLYLHRCPVCQVTRPARTRAALWRCANCGERMVVE